MADVPEAIGSAGTIPAQCIGERYDVLGWIGAGGMGNVYRVRDRELDEVVALKMLRRELVGDAQSLARFRQEVKLARRVTHQNVARTFDIGEHDGEKFLTMEFVDGESLTLVIARGAIAADAAIEIAVAVCAGLEAAHDAGVVHRDLKPDNVIVAANGRVVITDFGIARAPVDDRSSGTFAGTPAYMAPEQVEGKPVDGRADVYAFGAMLYEMVTGRMAWEGGSPFLVATRRLAEPPPDPRTMRPDISDALARAIVRCMARAPADRFEHARDLVAELRAARAAPKPTHDAGAAVAMTVSQPTETTVAVLPLRNAGSFDDYVIDGLTDDLIDTLSMTPGLLVRPRGVVARHAPSDGDPRLVGRELGVQVVVDGSARKIGDLVRLALRVISVAEGFQLWAGRFDARAADLLVATDEAARAIATALTVKVVAPLRQAPSDALAIDCYFRARHEFRRSWHSDMKLAVEWFDKALELAPDNPEILAGAAIASSRMAFFDSSSDAAVTRARELAERAVRLAPHHGDSWAALASAHMNAGDPLGAVAVLRKGVETTPKSALLQEMTGRVLLEVGDANQAITRLETALALDPTAVAPEFELARAFAAIGDWARCDEILARPTLDAASRNISRARFALWRRAPSPAPPETTPADSYQRLWCQILTRPTLDDEQRDFMKRRTETAGKRLRALFWQRNAEIHAYVGEVDRALDSFAGALDAGLIDVLWADRCPLFDGMRASPRWTPLRDRLADRVAPIARTLGCYLQPPASI